jgi:hypothetical protein
MKVFVTEYRQKLKTVEQVEIAGHGQKINGIWYYIVDEKEREDITSTLKTYME